MQVLQMYALHMDIPVGHGGYWLVRRLWLADLFPVKKMKSIYGLVCGRDQETLKPLQPEGEQYKTTSL